MLPDNGYNICQKEEEGGSQTFILWNYKHDIKRKASRWTNPVCEHAVNLYLLLTILTAYFWPVFLWVHRLQIEKLPSPRALSLRSIS